MTVASSDEDDKELVSSCFRRYDAKGDGMMDSVAIKNVLMELGCDKETIEFIVPALETKEGRINVDELIAYIIQGERPSRLKNGYTATQAPATAEKPKTEDPRVTISRFFQSGDARGPNGCIDNPAGGLHGEKSTWFVVFRPTSDVAIETMVSGIGCGKCLEVKGKSALRGPMSGRVPLMQISDNNHKKQLSTASRSSRLEVFYQSDEARRAALSELMIVMNEMQSDVKLAQSTSEQQGKGLITLSDDEEAEMYEKMKFQMDDPRIESIDEFNASGSFGLEMPERLLLQAYVFRKDITHPPGWETGRKSVAAFMNMNLHALHDSDRGNNRGLPHASLLQGDGDSPMNPHGLLMSYAANGEVRAVVSDFDCFVIGSRGMNFEEIVKDQTQIAAWSATHTEAILGEPGDQSWSFRWLEVLKAESEKGFHPEIPKFGFGDPTSDAIMQKLAEAMTSTGGVRHGAECFNFYFPQELDTEYLVLWDGYGGLEEKPWRYLGEPEMRAFLLDRVADGFSFPVNPCWPMRDAGWYEILQALRTNPATSHRLQAWYPEGSGTLETIDRVHAAYPDGFMMCASPDGGQAVDHEMSSMELADLGMHELKRHQTLKRAKRKLKTMLMFMSLKRRMGGLAGLAAQAEKEEAEEAEQTAQAIKEEAAEAEQTG